MAEFDAEPSERCEGVNDEPTAVASTVIALVGIRPLLDGTVDTDRVRHPFVLSPRMRLASLSRAVNRRTHTRRVSVASVVLRVSSGSPPAIGHGELGDRFEGRVTGLVDEHALVRDRRHHIVLDEFTNETAGSRLVDVRRRDPGPIPVLGDEFGFESFVVAVVSSRISGPVTKAHALDALRARLTPSGADKPTGWRVPTSR